MYHLQTFAKRRNNVLKKKQPTPDGLTLLSPVSPNQDLIPNLTAVSASSRSAILNQWKWNYPVSTGKVVYSIGCLCPPKEGDLPWNSPLFSRNYFISPLSASKASDFAWLFGAPLCLIGCWLIHDTEQSQSYLQISSAEFCFQQQKRAKKLLSIR